MKVTANIKSRLHAPRVQALMSAWRCAQRAAGNVEDLF